MKNWLIIVPLGAILFAAVALGWPLFQNSLASIDLPLSGILIMAAGACLTIGLGVGLMVLVFLSARRGHDDDVHQIGREIDAAEALPEDD
ncbi:MAG: hypothetical protein AAGF15_08400 [Pseudomonadota bacterium]